MASDCPVEMTAWGDDIAPGSLVLTSDTQKVSTFAAYVTAGWPCVKELTTITFHFVFLSFLPNIMICSVLCVKQWTRLPIVFIFVYF